MSEIRCPLEDIARIAPNQAAWLEEDTAHMFPSMHVAARSIAGLLQDELGVKPGDRVLIAAPTHWRWLPLLFGIFRVGAMACPLNTRLPAKALRERARLLNPAVQVIPDDGEALLEGVPCLRISSLCDVTMLGGPDARPVYLDLERPATCVFTSGSMGDPKAVVHSLEGHYYSALGANRLLPMNHHHRWMLTLPLYHVGGLGVIFRCLLSGAALVSPEPGVDPVETMLRHRVTHLSLVPTQLVRLMRHEKREQLASGLQRVLLGGAPISDDLVARALDAGFPVHRTYGMTETASQVSTVPRHALKPIREATDGAVLPHREVKISEAGEILVRGHILPLGKWTETGLEALTDDQGWLHSGDLGTLDDGYLKVTGRRDNQFVSGGENIQPEEIERHLLEITGAGVAVVVPQPDAEFGFRPVAWLDLPAETHTPAVWDTALRKFLPGYMVPVGYRVLPENAGLKPDRRLLSEKLCGKGGACI